MEDITDHSPPYSADIKRAWSYTKLYHGTAIKHRQLSDVIKQNTPM
jgi:hypothetical protein